MRVSQVSRSIVRRLAVGEYESVEVAAQVTAECDDGDDRFRVQRMVDAMARVDASYSMVHELEAVVTRREAWPREAWKDRGQSQAIVNGQLDSARAEYAAALHELLALTDDLEAEQAIKDELAALGSEAPDAAEPTQQQQQPPAPDPKAKLREKLEALKEEIKTASPERKAAVKKQLVAVSKALKEG